jgi:GTPase
VLNQQLHDGCFDMTVRVEPSRRGIVVSRSDAEPRGTWDSEYADPQPD